MGSIVRRVKALLHVDSPGRAYAWLLSFGITRTVLDYSWIPIPADAELLFKILVLFNYTVYQFTLYLLIPSIAGFVLEKVFSRPVDASGVLRGSVLVWIVYPAVTVISLILKSPPTRTIEWFRYIPTFMVDYNFLPAGMLAVIPIVIVFYTRLMMLHSGATWWKALSSVLVSLWLVYLVYYQYTAQLFLYFLLRYGPILAFGYYTLTYLLPLFPIASRFHSAFGPHRLMLQRLFLVCAIVCVGLMAVALPSALASGEQASVKLTSSAITPQWNLRRYQLYDQADAVVAYGYYLDKKSAGRTVRVFRLFRPDSFFLPNLEYVKSDENGLSYRDLLDIRVGASKLTFDWNRADAQGDPLLESLHGTEAIPECTARLDGQNYRCFMLDETLTTDVLELGSWPSETFLAVSGADVSLIAFSVEDYTDGLIAIRNRRHRVTNVTRQGTEVRIAFQGGTAVADCTLLAEYETLRVVEPQPVDSPARCEVIIRPDRGPEITTTVDGLLERIGTTQGTGE